MKKLIPLLVMLIIAAACKDKKQEEVTPETNLVTQITSGQDTWNFEYDTDLRMSSATNTNAYNTTKITFLYGPQGHVESAISTVSGTSEEARRKFSYDAQSRLTGISQAYFENSKEYEKQITEVDYLDNGLIWVHEPGAYENGGNYYKFEGENMKNIICFDCLSSSFDHTYTGIENFLPAELRKYWNFYAGGRFIKFMGFYAMGSENMIERFFDFGPSGYLPSALKNRYEVDAATGKILKVHSVVIAAQHFFVPSNYAVGDTLASYEFTYSEF